MKYITIIMILLSGISVFGNTFDNSEAPTYKHSNQAITNQDQTLGKQKCWTVDGGVEWLYMTSTLTTTFSDEYFLLSQIAPPNNFSLNDRIIKSFNPDYNSGFATHLKFRIPTNNDLGLYYKYIRNNGDGSLNRDETGVRAAGATEQNIQHDKGSFHSHLHVIDFMFGQTFDLAPSLTLRLAGGLCYNDWHLGIRFDDNDQIIRRDNTGAITYDVINVLKAESKNTIWGLGPKLEADFEYYFLPKTWNHDLNLFFEAQFALLYSKEWSNGRYSTLNITQTPPPPPTTSASEVRWHNLPKFELIPNINLDMGINYNCYTSNGIIVKFAAGYRILAYWELDEFLRRSSYQGGDSIFPYTSGIERVFSYSGPYINFSLAY
jgi:hypothetical protein